MHERRNRSIRLSNSEWERICRQAHRFVETASAHRTEGNAPRMPPGEFCRIILLQAVKVLEEDPGEPPLTPAELLEQARARLTRLEGTRGRPGKKVPA